MLYGLAPACSPVEPPKGEFNMGVEMRAEAPIMALMNGLVVYRATASTGFPTLQVARPKGEVESIRTELGRGFQTVT